MNVYLPVLLTLVPIVSAVLEISKIVVGPGRVLVYTRRNPLVGTTASRRASFTAESANASKDERPIFQSPTADSHIGFATIPSIEYPRSGPLCS